MECTRCGAINEPNKMFCAYCGWDLPQSTASQTPTQSYQTGPQGDQQDPAQGYQPPAQDYPPLQNYQPQAAHQAYQQAPPLRSAPINYTAKRHIISILPGVLIAVLLAGGSVSVLLDGYFVDAAQMMIPAIVVLIFVILSYVSQSLSVSGNRVSGRVGLIRSKRMESPINRIDGVAVSSGLFGKLFNYGKVTITTPSGVYSFKAISDANYFQDMLMQQIDRRYQDR